MRSAEQALVHQTSTLFVVVKALRLHQWVKNFLLFVPLVVAHKMMEIGTLLQVLVAFIGFSLCASSGYIVNDLLDLKLIDNTRRSDIVLLRQEFYKFRPAELFPSS